MSKKTLLASDLDNTLIDGNSNMQVTTLMPNSIVPDDMDIIENHRDGWTAYMRSLFTFLHKKGITPENLYESLSNLKMVEGMKELLTAVKESGKYDIIIISDANTVFVDYYLNTNGLKDIVKDCFTNPSSFTDQGCLTIQEYQRQDTCSRCYRNMCKGYVLLEYMDRSAKAGTIYEKVAYIGDGINDLCPAMKVNEHDLVFARKGFPLMEGLRKLNLRENIKPAATVQEWTTGFDIMRELIPGS